MVPRNDDLAFLQMYLYSRHSILVDFWLTDVLCIENIQYILIYSMYFLLYKSDMKSTQRKRLPLHPEQNMNLLFCLLVGLGLVLGNFHPVTQTAKIPKIEGLKRLRRNREGNTWLTNGIHWLIGTYILLNRTRTRTKTRS